MTEGSPDVAAVEARQAADRVVVVLRGELDLSNVGDLERAVAAYLEDPGVAAFVFDMTDLAFMDSTVIAVLLKAARAGKRVSLRHPSELIRQVISTTGLGGVLQLEA